jgi:hypothetical protein
MFMVALRPNVRTVGDFLPGFNVQELVFLFVTTTHVLFLSRVRISHIKIPCSVVPYKIIGLNTIYVIVVSVISFYGFVSKSQQCKREMF